MQSELQTSLKRRRSRSQRRGETSTPRVVSDTPRAPRAGNILESGIANVDPKWRLMVQMTWAARRWRTLLDQRLRQIGHNAARMEALATIAYSSPDATQVQIANRIGIERATITRMIDALEADGLVERLADPTDRRTNRIRVTDAGRAALAEIQGIVNAMRADLLGFADLGTIDTTNAFLAQMLVQLDTGLPEPDAD